MALALPLILVRLLYSAISLSYDLSDPTAGFPTSRTVKILMNVIPEIILTAWLLSVGLWTRDIKKLYTKVEGKSVGSMRGYGGMERGLEEQGSQ